MAYCTRTSLGISFGLALSLLGGCDDPAPSLLGGSSANGATDGGTATGPCSAGTTDKCDCPVDDAGAPQTGTRSCFSGQWSHCFCRSVTPPTAIKIEGECKAGHYEGTFQGTYTSGYTFIGVPIPVFALDPAGGTGLAFTLNKNVQSAGGEFDIYTISDGYVKGTADGLFPFEGKLTGELDCATKMFTGTMSGGYCATPLCVEVDEAKFEGPITGVYDSDGFKFTSGTWNLQELDGNSGPFGAYGGEGQWDATWVSEGSVDTTTGQDTTDGGAGAP